MSMITIHCPQLSNANEENKMSESMNLSGTRVMLVDDSNVIRHCARTFLSSAGCEVFIAEDGFDAITQIAERCPDLILLDAIMPRLDGYKTCALIKGNEKYKHIPIIMLSAKDSLFDRMRARLVGANDYLTKPFAKETVLHAVATHRRQSAQSAGLTPHFGFAAA